MRLSIELPDWLHTELKVRAAQEGKTISQVVRPMIETYTNSTVPKGTTKEEWDDSLAAVRTVRPISKADQAKGKSRK